MTVYDVWPIRGLPYERNRIPGMLVTSRGTLIVYNEARDEAGDWSRMDIFMQRSEDGGAHFDAPIFLACGNEHIPTVNNPVMVEDARARLHLLYCENYGTAGGRVLRRVSLDDGRTWSAPYDLTEATHPAYRNAFALGPGHGIRTPSGTLLIPVWMVPKRHCMPLSAHDPSEVATLYSLDDGETWQMGELLRGDCEVPSPNETELCLTSDGRVYLNARNFSNRRAVAYSENGYEGWTALMADDALVGKRCFGSVVSYHHGGRQAILCCQCADTEVRRRVTVRVSLDDGKSWVREKILDAERGGYVESAVDNTRGVIYVLYENEGGTTCHLAVFDCDWLMNE